MSFDLRSYAREREKNKQSSEHNTQETRSNTFDLKDYAYRRKAGQVAEGLTGRINKWLEDSGKYVGSYNSRFVGRDGSTYVSDSDQWLTDTVMRKSILDQERSSILADINQYGKWMDQNWVQSVTEALESSNQTQGSILDTARQDRDFWKQFNPSEEQVAAGYTAESLYQNWYKDDSYRKKHQGKSYAQVMETIAGMEDGEEKTWLTENAAGFMTAEDYDSEIIKVDQELEKNRKELHDLLGVGGADYFTPEEINRGHELQNTIAELSTRRIELEGGKKYGFLSENEDYNANTTYQADRSNQSLTYKLINGYSSDFIEGVKDQGWGTIYEIVEHMTEKEKADYNYLFHTKGEEEADAYFKYIKPELNKRRMGEISQEKAALATEHPRLADLESLAANLTSGVGILDALGQQFVNGVYAPIDYNRPAMTGSVVSSTIRKTRAQNLAQEHGVIDLKEDKHPILSKILNGKSWGDVYQLGMSMADSTAVALMSPVLGTAGTLLLSGSTATQTMLQAAENGATDEQALTMGALSGAFEYLFEKYELEGLLKNGSENVIRAFTAQALSEGFGEGATTIANTLADTIVMADKSEVNRIAAEYMKADPTLSEKDALKKAWMDIAIQTGWDVVGGVASGGIMGGGYSAINWGANKLQSLAQEKVNAEQDALQQLANEMNGVGKQHISMVDFANRESPVWRNVDYADNDTKISIMQDAHNAMVAEGAVVKVSDEIADTVDQAYPDLRNMKKKERTPILRSAMNKLKNDIRQFLNGFKNQTFEFDVNGKVLDATLYNTGINEVLEKVSKEKANMLYSTEDIFRNARYLYSTQDYAGDPNVYRWNYFYTPVQIGNETVGVRIAIRDLAKQGESQIYNWGIKKDASLGGVRDDSENRKPYGASSDASTNNISQTMPGVNGEISSAEGQVLRGSDPVQISDIDTAGNGKLTVRLADGSTADVSELSFPDMGEQELWRVLAEYSDNAEVARQLLKEYRAGDLNAYEYAKGVEEAFMYGKLNISEGEMSQRGSYVNLLNPMQQNAAYQHGQYAGEKQTKQRQVNVDAVYKQAKSVLQQKGKTHKDTYRAVAVDGISIENMKPSQKEAFHLAEMIAPGIQANIEVYNGGKEWGYYNPRTDTIRLNINANWSEKSMLAFTLGHELIHRAKRGSPVKYKAFADFLVQQYGKQGSSVEKMIAEQLDVAAEYDKTIPENQRLNMTEEQAFEEVVADACQRMLLDTNAGQRLAEFGAKSEQNRDFLHRFAKKLREILDELRDIFKNVVPDSLAAQEFARFDATTKQILADMFVDMSIDAGEKLSTIKAAGMTEKITTDNGGVKYKLNKDAKTELHKALYDRNYQGEILLRDETPAIMLAQKGVKNLPMAMKVSHVRENVFTEAEAKKLGLKIDSHTHYHGLGETFFLQVIDGLDNVKEGYRGTKNADNPARRENYFLLVSEFTDTDGNTINVPVYINEHALYNRVFIDINKISTVFGRQNFRDYIAAQIKKGNLVRIKNRSNLTSESNALIARDYGKSASKDSIRNPEQNVNKNSEEVEKVPFKLPVSKDVSDREMLVDMFEQMVTDSKEYKALENYRKHIQEMLDIEEKLERINGEITRLSFAKGPRDTETLNKLKIQQNKAVNRLNYYDNILLGLEKSGVLRAMIERNQKKIASAIEHQQKKRTQERLDKASAYYRERNERRESELRQYYRESRRKAVERHDMAQVRQQIRKDVQRLDSLLNKGTKKRNVKLGLQEIVGAALRLAKGSFLLDYNEYDMIRSGLQNKLLPEEQEAFDRCRELLKELDELPKEPGVDNLHDKWDPDAKMRRNDQEEALKRELYQNMRILRDGNVFQRERAGAEDATAEQLADELLAAYQKLIEPEFEHLQGLFSRDIYKQIEKTKEFLKGKAIKDMTSVELKELQKLYRMISETVSRADEMFGAHRNEKTSKRGDRMRDQLATDRNADMNAFVAKLNDFTLSLLTPEALAAVIGSEELTQAIREVEATETVQQQDLEHAKQYAAEQVKKFNRKNWDTSKQVEFAGTEITIGQAMALFAYTERKAGRDHISGDGFTHSKSVPIKKKLGKLQISSKFIKDVTRSYRVTEDMYDELGKLLTDEQKGYARAMRDYLAEVMGAKGNEVSRELYGIDMYGEKFYFPLKSAKDFMDSVLGARRGEVKVTNKGWTNPIQEGASNAIVLEDFETVWSRHVQEMSNYHASAVAMENFNRLYNYRKTEQRETTDKWGQPITEEVKSSETISLLIERRSAGATGYLTKWMESVNGGVRSDATEKLLGGLLGNFRKTKVLGNLSVIIQQPTAILRAVPYLGKDFLAGWKTWKTTTPEKGLIREMYRYCPVAGLKKMGGFDPSAGQTVRQYLFDGRDDAKGKLRKGIDKTNEVLGKAPEKMDELAWSYLWLGCKKKTLRENRNLRAGSKEHCEAAAELFTKIVRETQVYDSVMSKPLIMQSKSALTKSLTSFMNEPLKGLNQCITAVARAKSGEITKGQAAEHIVCVAASNLLATAVSCLIYALRDDDEDETYWEKYLKHLSGGVLDALIPLNSVPGLKEIVSIVQGYGNERSEFALIADAWDGIMAICAGSMPESPEEWEKAIWNRLEDLGNVLTISGVPVRNLIREVRSVYYTIKRAGTVQATEAGVRYAVREGITGKEVSKTDQLYNAVVEDDGTHLTRVMATWDDPKTAVSNMVSAVKNAYLDGKITDDRATEYLQEFGGKSLEQVSDYLSEWGFKKTYPDSEIKDSNARNYMELAKPAGISLEVYTRFCKETEGLEADKDEDGNDIQNSKRKKVWKVIHSLPLSDKQKDALHYAAGYAESSLDDAPWN